MTTTLEIDHAAEACVVAALRKLRFSIFLADGAGHGAVVINAWQAKRHILVRVNTIVSPAEPHSLTLDEEQDLRYQAAQAGAQPWEAQVFLGPDLELVQLEWRPLERSGAGE